MVGKGVVLREGEEKKESQMIIKHKKEGTHLQRKQGITALVHDDKRGRAVDPYLTF